MADAQEMLLAPKERLANFGLRLHEETRPIKFGRFAALSRRTRPETFAFLDITH